MLNKRLLGEEELSGLLLRLSDAEALEICPDGQGNVYIPYMMNDAAECFIKLSDCELSGNVSYREMWTFVDLRESEEEDEMELLLLNEHDEMVYIHFKESEMTANCYQYHRIAHFWAKGQEGWRRLAYICGTLHVKCEYMPEDMYTEEEYELGRLIDFAPLRYFDPVEENPEEVDFGTLSGLEKAEELAEKIGSHSLNRLLMEYRTYFVTGKLDVQKIREAADRFRREEGFYLEVNRLIDRASSKWPERTYSVQEEEAMFEARRKIDKDMSGLGYSGVYPVYQKEKLQRIYYEEHPFMMKECEYEDFTYRISGYIERPADTAD